MTALRSLLFLILAPGMVAGYVPLAGLRIGPRLDTGFFAYFAFPLWIPGGMILLWSFWDFLARGGGTPAPIDPPKELVATGFYRYVRNPMYVAVLAVILGHFVWFGYWTLLIYALVVFVAFHAFVIYYEEPTLKKKIRRRVRGLPEEGPALDSRIEIAIRIARSAVDSCTGRTPVCFAWQMRQVCG